MKRHTHGFAPNVPQLHAVTEEPLVHVLMFESNSMAATVVHDTLTNANDGNFNVEWYNRFPEFLDRLSKGSVDVILIALPASDCPTTLAQAKLYERAGSALILPLSEPGEYVEKTMSGWTLEDKIVEQRLLDIPWIRSAMHYVWQRKKTAARTQKMAYLAHHDSLTGLANRALLEERMKQALSFARRHRNKIALLFIDMNDFKQINDTLGHKTGDAALKLLAERLLTCVRDTDTVSRHGGDEFVVLLSEIDEHADVNQVIEKILEAISEPIIVDDHEFLLTMSIGVSVYPHDGDTLDSLLSHADLAMYRTKGNGTYPRKVELPYPDLFG